MLINVARIPEEGLQLTEEEPPEILELEEDGEFRAAGPVRCDLFAEVVAGGLLVRGTLTAPLKARCARCTQFFSTTVADSAFLRDFPGVQETEEVDITEDVREAILLNLPHFPLCAESCRGLCLQCGKNLNEGSCGCEHGESGGAWTALDSLNL